jgi:plastocyanin domain-containing protein
MLDTIKRSLAAHGHPEPAGRVVRIRVRGGYIPDTIHAETGVPLRLLFKREETSSCSEQVVFPGFGKSALLPTGEQVAVDLLPDAPGEYEFTCAMKMLHGRLIVEDPT